MLLPWQTISLMVLLTSPEGDNAAYSEKWVGHITFQANTGGAASVLILCLEDGAVRSTNLNQS